MDKKFCINAVRGKDQSLVDYVVLFSLKKMKIELMKGYKREGVKGKEREVVDEGGEARNDMIKNQAANEKRRACAHRGR